MTARQLIEALLAYDMDTPLWVGKGMGPLGGVEPFTTAAGETVLIIKPVSS